MAHVITSSISETECIGDSLNTKINPNFLNLDNSVQSLSTSVQNLSTSVQNLSTNKNIFTDNVGIGTSLPKSNLTINGSFATSAPIVVTTSSYTVPASATSLIHSFTSNSGYILPSPSACPGQWLYIKTVTAVTLSSTSTNVEPLSSTTPINRILPQIGAAAIGKWVNLQSDGTDWVAMAGN